jgi:NitT/TauT family transport system substrate-binding protein
MSYLRSFLTAAATAFALLSSVALGAAEDKALTITEPAHSIDSMPFYVALSEGFFTKHGLDVTLYTAEGGGQHIAAVLSGDAAAFIGGPEHNAFALLKGRDVRAVMSLSSRANAYIVARPDLGITAETPLKEILAGRTIAVGAQGGTHNSLLRAMLAREGLDASKDVTLVEITNSAGTLAAMKAGQVDLAVTLEPLITQGMKEGIWTDAVVSFPDYFGPFEYTTLNVPLEMIESDPETVQKMVAALKEALAFCFANPQRVEELARKEFPTMPVDDLKAMLARTLADDLWQPDGKTAEKGWQQVEAIVRDAGLLSRPVAYAEIFDTRFQ